MYFAASVRTTTAKTTTGDQPKTSAPIATRTRDRSRPAETAETPKAETGETATAETNATAGIEPRATGMARSGVRIELIAR